MTPKKPPKPHKYVVGLPDSRGGMCWLAGYVSDPTRYYTASSALRFATFNGARAAITRAEKTHVGRTRAYEIIHLDDMDLYNRKD